MGFTVQHMEISTLRFLLCCGEGSEVSRIAIQHLDPLTYGGIPWFQFLVFCKASMRVLLYSAICLDAFFIMAR